MEFQWTSTAKTKPKQKPHKTKKEDILISKLTKLQEQNIVVQAERRTEM